MVLHMSRQVGERPERVSVDESARGGILFKMRGEIATAHIGPRSFAHSSSGIRLCENPTYLLGRGSARGAVEGEGGVIAHNMTQPLLRRSRSRRYRPFSDCMLESVLLDSYLLLPVGESGCEAACRCLRRILTTS